MTVQDLLGDPKVPVIFEGDQVQEFADLMAQLPAPNPKRARPQVALQNTLRTAIRIIGTPGSSSAIPGTQFGYAFGRTWSAEFPA
jgi:hypothetical protein